MKGVRNVGETWRSVLGYGEGVSDVRKNGEDVGEVWKSLWGECGGCGEVGESVLGYMEEWKNVGGPHTFLHLPTHPTHLLKLIQHLFPTQPILT